MLDSLSISADTKTDMNNMIRIQFIRRFNK